MSDKPAEFLTRWSRLKEEARLAKEKEAELPPVEVELQPEDEDATLPETQDEGEQETSKEEASEDDAIDPSEFDDVNFDELNYESDYSRFMKKGVPEAIRRRALSKLWSSNPILAVLDGMNDYDEDFTDAALVIEGMKSAWRPGKGYAKDEEEEKKVSEADEETTSTDEDGKAEEITQETEGEDDGDGEEAQQASLDEVDEAEDIEAEAIAPRPVEDIEKA